MTRARLGFVLLVLLGYVALGGTPMPSSIPDASPTVRGVVSTSDQAFQGVKSFDAGVRALFYTLLDGGAVGASSAQRREVQCMGRNGPLGAYWAYPQPMCGWQQRATGHVDTSHGGMPHGFSYSCGGNVTCLELVTALPDAGIAQVCTLCSETAGEPGGGVTHWSCPDGGTLAADYGYWIRETQGFPFANCVYWSINAPSLEADAL